MSIGMSVNGVEVMVGSLPRDTRGRLAFDFICFAATHSADAQSVVDLALASADEIMQRFGVENVGEGDAAGALDRAKGGGAWQRCEGCMAAEIARLRAALEAARAESGVVKHTNAAECQAAGCGCMALGIDEIVALLRERAETAESQLAESERLRKVAEPEQPKPKFRAEPDRAEQPKYDSDADWTRHPDPSGNNDVHWTCNYCGVYRDRPPKAPHDHAECRGRTRKQPTPPEPVMTADDPVFLAYQHAYNLRDDRDEETRQRVGLAAALIRDRELRSNAHEGQADTVQPAVAARHEAADRRQEPGAKANASPARAVDPRRLTDEEMMALFAQSYHTAGSAGIRGAAFMTHRLRAVADAQLAKANAAAKPVTISKAEISQVVRSPFPFEEVVKLLRRHGVEVV